MCPLRLASIPLGVLGAAAAVLLWWRLAGEIASPPGGAATSVRLALGLAALLPATVVLWVMLLTQMAGRFVSVRTDPLDGPDPRLLQINQRVITNTVEHLLVFAPALLALAAGLDGPGMAGVVALGIVFAVARVAFWAGYLLAPIGRAIGMAATLAATTAAVAGALSVWSGVVSVL